MTIHLRIKTRFTPSCGFLLAPTPLLNLADCQTSNPASLRRLRVKTNHLDSSLLRPRRNTWDWGKKGPLSQVVQYFKDPSAPRTLSNHKLFPANRTIISHRPAVRRPYGCNVDNPAAQELYPSWYVFCRIQSAIMQTPRRSSPRISSLYPPLVFADQPMTAYPLGSPLGVQARILTSIVAVQWLLPASVHSYKSSFAVHANHNIVGFR